MGWETLLLFAFAFLAGFIDSIVGGGGLIQLPALMIFLPPGTPVALALGTNKLASVCGTGVALGRYAVSVPIEWRTSVVTAAFAFLTSMLGAYVVIQVSSTLLRPIVFGLFVFVAVFTFSRRRMGVGATDLPPPPRGSPLWVLAGGVIGFYDGFFGPGTGQFLIFFYVAVAHLDFLRASASAKVVNAATNVAALILFGSKGQIDWALGLSMGGCNILGSLLGTRLAIKRGAGFIRGLFLAIVGVLILKLAWDTFKVVWEALPG